MQKAIFKPGLPDYITIETEEWREILREKIHLPGMCLWRSKRRERG